MRTQPSTEESGDQLSARQKEPGLQVQSPHLCSGPPHPLPEQRPSAERPMGVGCSLPVLSNIALLLVPVGQWKHGCTMEGLNISF